MSRPPYAVEWMAAGDRNEEPTMNVKQTLSAIRALGVGVTRTSEGEYRVKPRGLGESAAYYTTDAEDALATARRMAAPEKSRAGPKPGGVRLAHDVAPKPDDESTALPREPESLMRQRAIERAYRAACVLAEHGHGNEAVDEILLALTPLILPSRCAQIESEVKSDPEAGLEGG